VQKMLARMLAVPQIIAMSLFVAVLPVLIHEKNHHVVFDWAKSWTEVTAYVSGIFSGQAYIFRTGVTQHYYFQEIGSYFQYSFGYLITAS